MVNLSKKFGVEKSLLQLFLDQVSSDRTGGNGGITTFEVDELIEWMIPKPCGHELIRIGGSGDGAYLVPDDLSGIEACFSPGTNNYKYFEDTLATDFGIKSFMCDFTSSVEKFHTPLIKGMQSFEKKWLDVSASPDNLDINNWVAANSAPDTDLMLQIDIEGAEYRNLLHATDETLTRFRIIVIELHGLAYLSKEEFREGIFGPVIQKLSRHFTCVHAHPNNCCGVTVHGGAAVPSVFELTLLRNDRRRPGGERLELPNRLDVVNVDRLPPISLEGPWLKHADAEASLAQATENRLAWLEKQVTLLVDDKAKRVKRDELSDFLIRRCLPNANLARGKRTRQSAADKSVRTSEAFAGVRDSGRGIRTDKHASPWWSIDLGAVYELDGIVVYNRTRGKPLCARGLRVQASSDGEGWVQIARHRAKTSFGGHELLNGIGPFFVNCKKMKARYVRLVGAGETMLDLEDVEIYGSIASD